MFKRKWIVERALVVAGLALLVVGITKVAAQNVTQGYGSDSVLQNGLIVQLVPGDASKIEPLTQSTATSMLGVTVSPGNSPVSLSNNGAAAQDYVATYGQYNVLVSDQNGSIKDGDFITISSLDGVGMKAGSSQAVIIGKALSSFDGKTNVVSDTKLTTSNGSQAVALGYVSVNISVAHNPLYQKQIAKPAGVPSFLASAAKVVTDKPLAPARIYAALAALLVAFIIAGALLYAGVRSSLTAVGRNPLARHSIMRGLLQVILLALIVVSTGIVAVYLLLKV